MVLHLGMHVAVETEITRDALNEPLLILRAIVYKPLS